jgi:hypothetical protein
VTALRIASVRGRYYDTPDGLFPSVTSILDVLPKPGLVGWAERMMRDKAIKEAAELFMRSRGESGPFTVEGFKLALAEVLGDRASDQYKGKAADYGHEVHALIEADLRGESVVPTPPYAGTVEAFRKWREAVKLRPVAVERTVWSKTYGYAGTLDVMGHLELPGIGEVFAVGDWKTGRAIYESAYLQNAAYAHAVVEMGLAEPPVHGVIVRLPKRAGTFPDVRPVHVDKQRLYFDTFKAALSLRAFLEEVAGEMREARE